MNIRRLTVRVFVFFCLGIFVAFSGLALAAKSKQVAMSQSSTDLTSSFKIDRGGLVFNRYTKTYDTVIKVTNISNESIELPIALVILDTPSGVSILSPSGTTLEGKPYLAVGSTGQSLNSGARTTVVLKYLNPTKLRISSTFRILAFSAINDQGLGGSDTNNNGVRDAIEATVTAHFSSSAKQRVAAFQVLSGYRTVLLKQATVEEAFNAVSDYLKAKACMKNIMGAFTGNYKNYEQEASYLRNIMLDNKNRIKAWLQSSDKVAGQVFFDPEGQPCDFDPNSLPN